MSGYFVYIIRCADATLYTGVTTDVARRFAEHRSGRGARYTRAHGALRVVHEERAADRGLAQRREAVIKRMSRAEKLALIRASRTKHGKKKG